MRAPKAHSDSWNRRQADSPTREGVCTVSGACGRTLGNEYAIRDFSFVSIPAVMPLSIRTVPGPHDLWGWVDGPNTYIFSCAGLAGPASMTQTCHLASIATLTWIP